MPMTAPDFPRGASMEFLRVVDLTKHFGEEAAIAGATFSAAAGEVLGVVGPNGAGKTTLLEAMAGLVGADSGDVFWLGNALPAPRGKAALFYLPDGVKPYQDRFTIQVLTFFAGVYRRSAADLASAIVSRTTARAAKARERFVQGLQSAASAGDRPFDTAPHGADGRAVRRL